MGMWGFGPTQSDHALDFLGTVRDILDEVWRPLRSGANDRATLARADEAAAIVAALGASGIDVTPRDSLELAALPEVPSTVKAALSAQVPPVRPPFHDEGTVEKQLREQRVPYELWSWAAQFGDDRDGAWRACSDPDHLIAFAQAYGIGYRTIQSAIAASIATIGDSTQYREPPFDAVPSILATVARGESVDAERIETSTQRLRALNDAYHERSMEARRTGRTAAAGDLPPHDERLVILGLALDLASPPRRGTTRWVRPLPTLFGDLAVLTQKLRDQLSPSLASVRAP